MMNIKGNKTGVFYSLIIIMSSLSSNFLKASYSKKDLIGIYQVKYPQFDEIKKLCYNKPDCFKGPGAIAILPLGIVIDLKETEVSMFTDLNLIKIELGLLEAKDYKVEREYLGKGTWDLTGDIITCHLNEFHTDQPVKAAIKIISRQGDSWKAEFKPENDNDVQQITLAPFTHS